MAESLFYILAYYDRGRCWTIPGSTQNYSCLCIQELLLAVLSGPYVVLSVTQKQEQVKHRQKELFLPRKAW